MKRTPALLVFFALFLSSLLAGICSYQAQCRYLSDNVNRALTAAMQDCAFSRMDADTLKAFRQHITIAEVRDTAYISVRSHRIGNAEHMCYEANAGCTILTVLRLSDQRLSGLLSALSLLWLAAFLFYDHRHHRHASALLPVGSMIKGNLCYAPDSSRFLTPDGTELHFTPLQRQLLRLFLQSPAHTLSKQEICEALWPGKPDASETLYALVSRLKSPLEKQCGLTIVSDRGRAYQLKDSNP